MARVYRCIGARRWDAGDPMAHVPPVDLPAVPGRWNGPGQYTLYTTHRAAVAIEEKRRHLARSPRTLVGSLLAAIGDEAASEVVVLGFESPSGHDLAAPQGGARETPETQRNAHRPPGGAAARGGPGTFRTFDGRAEPREGFDRWLEPCGDARAYAARLRKRGYDHLIVPSSPCPSDWNSVFYFLGSGQPGRDALPRRSACRVARRARVTSTEPDCTGHLDRRRRVTVQ